MSQMPELARYRIWLDVEATLKAADVDVAVRDQVFCAVMGRGGRSVDAYDMLYLLNAAVNAAGGQARFAKLANVSPPHLNMMLAGDRPISAAVYRAAGLRRVAVERFELVEEADRHAA